MNSTDLQAFEADTAKLVPGFTIAWKDESTFQKVAGWFAKVFNPAYMTSYTTTFYPKVWFPTKAFYEKDPTHSFLILAHERVHLLDTKKQPLWFRFSYVFPQILAVPLVLAGIALAFVVGGWSLIAFTLALACLPPWPAPWRVHWEQRGYAMSIACGFWLTGDIPLARRESIRKQFLGMAYFKMAWNEKAIDDWLDQVERSVRNGTLAAGDEVYGAVLQFLRERGMTKA